jgi:hypothetical protein
MVNKGSCSRDKCSYSHDKRVIAEAKAKDTLRHAERFNKGFPPQPPKKPPPDGSFVPLCQGECPARVCAMNAILGTVAPISSLHKSAMRQGFLHITGGRLVPAECLFDSGALHSSYISKVFLESIRSSVLDCIFPAEGNVFMADGVSQALITEKLRLPMSFVDDGGTAHTAELELAVLDMPQQVIIGLPHIVLKLLDLFVGMLSAVAESHSLQHVSELPSAPAPVTSIDLEAPFPPWSEPLEYSAEEEDLCPDPCSFSGPLHYLSMLYEDV